MLSEMTLDFTFKNYDVVEINNKKRGIVLNGDLLLNDGIDIAEIVDLKDLDFNQCKHRVTKIWRLRNHEKNFEVLYNTKEHRAMWGA